MGYHELSGTREQLKKPLLVLQKKVATGAVMLPQFSDSPPVELEVIGIIRQKILFKNRPKALTSSTDLSFSSKFKILLWVELIMVLI